MITDATTSTEYFHYGSGRFVVNPEGVWFEGGDNEADGGKVGRIWLSSPLRIVAEGRNEHGGEWSRLLVWEDGDGRKHQWLMPMAMLEGESSEIRSWLASQGVRIAQSRRARELLMAYLKYAITTRRVRCTNRLGWHGDLFVTGNGTIGKSDEMIVFQPSHAIEHATSSSGSVEQWRNDVAFFAQGNTRLVLALSLAFAGPLARLVGVDSGGVHFRGGSSIGKSTTLKVAASVSGHPKEVTRNWRSTANGLEGLAAIHNDGVLILDEIGQVDPAQLGDAIYMLANGQGKTRANRSGQAIQPMTWLTLVLSAGETSLAAMLQLAGRRATAGQEVRLAEVEADPGAGMGIFEDLHGYDNGAQMAQAIADATARYHGAVGHAWLTQLVDNAVIFRLTLPDRLQTIVRELLPKGAHGQAVRVARQFATFALAGELATEIGLTGWPIGEATRAAKGCFESWLDGFGGSESREARAIKAHVRGMLEAHGASRFEILNSVHEVRIQNRLGYVYEPNGEPEYAVFQEAFAREFCQGFDRKQVVNVLREAGMLVSDGRGSPTKPVRIPGAKKSQRMYVLRLPSDVGELDS